MGKRLRSLVHATGAEDHITLISWDNGSLANVHARQSNGCKESFREHVRFTWFYAEGEVNYNVSGEWVSGGGGG